MEKTVKTPKKKATVKTDEEISKAKMEKRRDEITNYYQENISHLETQLKYETLLKDIEQVRAERVQHQMFLAQAMAPPPEDGEEGATPVSMTQEEFQAAMAAQDMPAKRTLKRTE